jgi:hypothetical protein
VPTYREAIEAALTEWDNIWFHWNKSQESRNAVFMLRRVMRDDVYDDRLKQAVDFYMGYNPAPVTLELPLVQISTGSALYAKLTDKLAHCDPPVLQPPRASGRTGRVARVTAPAPDTSVRITNRLVPAPQAASSSRVVPVQARPSASTSRTGGLEANIRKHEAEWSSIEITDIPTGEYARYEHTASDFGTTTQKAAAAGVVRRYFGVIGTGEVLTHPGYWMELGRIVMKSKIGRCFSCSAAAVFTLVSDPAFDELTLMVMGSKKSDHYFVCVGTSAGAINAGNGTAVDIWQANLNKDPNSMCKTPCSSFMYWRGAMPICEIPTDKRTALRKFAAKREEEEIVV